ncbi:MAG: Forkhead-associated protein [Bryobacterales bacterium]|nr:Forkhead-associated protein [Bryobacterales bacterium]
MAARAAGRLQGDDLVIEVLRNMEEGLFRIRRKILVPAIYRIYLQPDDYAQFRDVEAFVRTEIRAALDEKLGQWNGSKIRLAKVLLEKIGAGESTEAGEYVRVADDWTVEIYPDLDGKLTPGEIEIYSELGAPQKADVSAGSVTRRIIPQKRDDATRPAAPVAESDEEDRTKGRSFAHIRYVDQNGPKEFDVTKNLIIIGRGGRSYWVDLRLETLTDVSREHCRIRRDADSGRFTIEDVSQFGTTVNGTPVGKDQSVELPDHATINLAGIAELEWNVA